MHGIQGKTLHWVQSYLVGRDQMVVLEGESSDEVSVSSGARQGSDGPYIVFITY